VIRGAHAKKQTCHVARQKKRGSQANESLGTTQNRPVLCPLGRKSMDERLSGKRGPGNGSAPFHG
jgi:hypothetical protein